MVLPSRRLACALAISTMMSSGAAFATASLEEVKPATAASGEAKAEAAEAPVRAMPPAAARLSGRPQPYTIVRSLQFLQDQIARGNDRAIAVQPRLLKRFSAVLDEEGPIAWSEPRNRRAGILFVLSGGDPHIVRALLDNASFSEVDRTLFEGAAAYAENRQADAVAAFEKVDVDELEPGLAAQINLVVAQLLQARRPEEALRRIDRVLLNAPGTILSESALRMGVLVAENAGHLIRADRFARRYFERYAFSSYAGNFRARFAKVYSERRDGTAASRLKAIETVTASLGPDERLAILLAVARRALVNGNLEIAHATARAALDSPAITQPDAYRGRLYALAATLQGDASESAQKALEAIPDDELHEADRVLKAMALDALDAADTPIAMTGDANETADSPQRDAQEDPSSLARTDNETVGSGDALVRRAEALLAETDADLENNR